MSAFRVVMVSSPRDKAATLSREIIEQGLAACVNIIDQIKSIYRWKGSIKTDDESLLIIKTTTQKVEGLIKYIR